MKLYIFAFAVASAISLMSCKTRTTNDNVAVTNEAFKYGSDAEIQQNFKLYQPIYERLLNLTFPTSQTSKIKIDWAQKWWFKSAPEASRVNPSGFISAETTSIVIYGETSYPDHKVVGMAPRCSAFFQHITESESKLMKPWGSIAIHADGPTLASGQKVCQTDRYKFDVNHGALQTEGTFVKGDVIQLSYHAENKRDGTKLQRLITIKSQVEKQGNLNVETVKSMEFNDNYLPNSFFQNDKGCKMRMICDFTKTKGLSR